MEIAGWNLKGETRMKNFFKKMTASVLACMVLLSGMSGGMPGTGGYVPSVWTGTWGCE